MTYLRLRPRDNAAEAESARSKIDLAVDWQHPLQVSKVNGSQLLSLGQSKAHPKPFFALMY